METLIQFFEELYRWFCGDSVLLYEPFCETFDTDEEIVLGSGFLWLGIITITVAFLSAFLFYKVIDHPKFKAWWAWLIMLLSTAVIGGLTAILSADVRVGHVLDVIEEIEVEYDEDMLETLSFTDYLSFGLVNFEVTIVFFILASLIFTWFGHSTKYSPFRK